MCIAAEHQLADLIDDDEDNMKEGKKGIQLDFSSPLSLSFPYKI